MSRKSSFHTQLVCRRFFRFLTAFPTLFAFLWVSLFVSISPPLMAAEQSLGLPRIQITLGFYSIDAEVAATFESRARGLMGRKNLEEHTGMLFIFPELEQHCMWMKNTPISLSVAFLDARGRIINIREMQPMSEANHCAAAPARYALEMKAGWFRKKGVKAGDSVRFPRGLPAPGVY